MFKRLFRRWRAPSPMSSPALDSDVWDGSTRDQWTVPGAYFETAGWRLVDATETRMSWVGRFGGTMTLVKDDTPTWRADDTDLEAVRRKQRLDAAERRGGLISAEVIEVASGALALEVVTKYPEGMGYRFAGCLLIDEAPDTYSLRLDIGEATTGVRESIVNTLRLQLGELDLAGLMSGPLNPATGGRTIPGMKLDPYDPAFDAQATYSASDDPRLDELLQTHPLAVIRSTLRRARATWDCASRAHRAVEAGLRLPHSSGPRVVLSEIFFEKLHAMVKDR